MTARLLFAALAVLGLVLPYAFFLPWAAAHGADLPRLFGDMFANRIAGFFAVDVIVSALALFAFMGVEWHHPPGGRRVPHLWAPILGTLSVGVSFGLPLYLFCRTFAGVRADA